MKENGNNPLHLTSLNHISLVCTSVEESIDFYKNILGFVPVRRPGSFDLNGAWLFGYGIGIHLLQSPNPEQMPKKGAINPKDNHISFQFSIVMLWDTRSLKSPVTQSCPDHELSTQKIGDFEMHLKRNIESPPMPVVSHTTPPPVASKPVIESALAAPPAFLPKSSSAKINPFSDAPVEKSAKLAALEASGATGYLLVSSTLVGSFRKGRTLKEGKKQPPICKEGHLIKEGQTIGFVDQFGTELPMKSNLSGEVLKILVDEGEAIGYGDPIIAVLPSFHGVYIPSSKISLLLNDEEAWSS